MIALLIDPGNIESHRRPRVSATCHSNVWQQQAMRSEWPPRSCPLDLSHDSIDFTSSKIVLDHLGMLNVRMRKKEMLWYHFIVIYYQGHSARTPPVSWAARSPTPTTTQSQDHTEFEWPRSFPGTRDPGVEARSPASRDLRHRGCV